MKHLLPTLLLFSITTFAQETMKPQETEVWEPEPVMVDPGSTPFVSPPADAIVLFDGSGTTQWRKPGTDEAIAWTIENNELLVKARTGAIETKESFGDVQLHIEWRAPVMEGREGQGYGNSGVFFMGMYEMQVLNSYENRTYSNGQAASIYKQHIPLVNASRPPGEWQSYDIIFNAPIFNKGKLVKPATLTAFHNGVLVQNQVVLRGPTEYIGIPSYKEHPSKLPLQLQDHGDPVRFRNIWIREL